MQVGGNVVQWWYLQIIITTIIINPYYLLNQMFCEVGKIYYSTLSTKALNILLAKKACIYFPTQIYQYTKDCSGFCSVYVVKTGICNDNMFPNINVIYLFIDTSNSNLCKEEDNHFWKAFFILFCLQAFTDFILAMTETETGEAGETNRSAYRQF